MYEKYYKFEINNNIYYILCKFEKKVIFDEIFKSYVFQKYIQ